MKDASGLLVDGKLTRKGETGYASFTLGFTALLFGLFRFQDTLNLIPRKDRLVTAVGTVQLVETYRIKGNSGVVTEDPSYPEQLHVALHDTFHFNHMQGYPKYRTVRDAVHRDGVLQVTVNDAIHEAERRTWQVIDGKDTLLNLAESRSFHAALERRKGAWSLGALVAALLAFAHAYRAISRRRSISLMTIGCFTLLLTANETMAEGQGSNKERSPVVYDKGDYHDETVQDHGLPEIQASVHTSFFLGWVIDNGLYSGLFGKESKEEISAYKSRKMTAVEVYETWDRGLTDEMLSEEGNGFAQFYFDFDKGFYLEDYAKHMQGKLPSEFHVLYTWKNQMKANAMIDKRFKAWKQGGKK